MRTKLSLLAVAALLAGGCGGGFEQPVSAQPDGLALVTVRPTQPASLSQSWMPGCDWCTTAFSAELMVTSSKTLTGVNLWLDGWSGNRRCLYSQHDRPVDGFTLPAGEAVTVAFSQASVECEAPFVIDRVDARARSGETLVYQGSWKVSLAFQE
jgi:hypothetical protein